MSKVAVEFWAFIAYALALIIVIASIILVFNYGSVEPSGYGGDKIINWPLIAGCVGSSLYAILFAVMFSVVRYIYIGKPPKSAGGYEERIETPSEGQ
jgi:uncharacterized integral membrane protein